MNAKESPSASTSFSVLSLVFQCLFCFSALFFFFWSALHNTESLWALFQGLIVEFQLGYPIFYLGTSKFSLQQGAISNPILLVAFCWWFDSGISGKLIQERISGSRSVASRSLKSSNTLGIWFWGFIVSLVLQLFI